MKFFKWHFFQKESIQFNFLRIHVNFFVGSGSSETNFIEEPLITDGNYEEFVNDTIAEPDVEVEDQIEGTVTKIKRGLVKNQMLKT